MPYIRFAAPQHQSQYHNDNAFAGSLEDVLGGILGLVGQLSDQQRREESPAPQTQPQQAPQSPQSPQAQPAQCERRNRRCHGGRPAHHQRLAHREAAHPIDFLGLANQFASPFGIVSPPNFADLDRFGGQPFIPKFDVQETQEGFEVHVDVPGYTKENLGIEWVDEDRLTISGKSVKKHQQTSEEPAVNEQPKTLADKPTEKSAEKAEEAHTPNSSAPPSPRAASVSDFNEETGTEKPISTFDISEGWEEATEDKTAGTKSKESSTVAKKKEEKKPEVGFHHGKQYHVKERSISSFERTVTFPKRVNEDSLTASLENGVLSISVKKAVRPAPKKIQIN